MTSKRFIVHKLKDIGSYKTFEEPITLKSGRQSKYYIDLRETVRFPKLLSKIADEISDLIRGEFGDNIDVVCGLPYGAIPLATLVAQRLDVGLLILRKERKEHGTKKMIEGLPDKSRIPQVPLRCVFVDDVITSGTSILESWNIFKDYETQVKVVGVAVIVDREEKKLEELDEFNMNYINLEVVSLLKLRDFIELGDPSGFLYRLEKTNNRVTKKLLRIACQKQSNLIVSIDNPDPKIAIDIAESVQSYACAIKFHYDIFSDFGEMSKELSERLNLDDLIIFEDRKFSDIGNTVKHQYYSIKKKYLDNGMNMDLTNAFVVCGQGIAEALYQSELSLNGGGDNCSTGLLLISSLSSKDNRLHKDTEKICEELIFRDRYKNFVSGLICQKRPSFRVFYDGEISNGDEVVYCTPGVNLDKTGDELNQQYRTVSDAIQRDNCDFIIVGRGICEEGEGSYSDRAERYRVEGWLSVLERNRFFD